MKQLAYCHFAPLVATDIKVTAYSTEVAAGTQSVLPNIVFRDGNQRSNTKLSIFIYYAYGYRR